MLSPNIQLFVLVAVVTAIVYRLRSKSKHPYPPGPPGDPLIGHVRIMPKEKAHLTFARWGKTYGPIISVRVFTQNIVVLNTAQAVSDLLDHRGTIYSDRPQNVMIQELADIKSIAFNPYNDHLRGARKLLNTALNPTAVRDYLTLQEMETHAMLGRLLVSPQNWPRHLRRLSASSSLTMAYGRLIEDEDDELITLSQKHVSNIRVAISTTSFLVNSIPALKHIPTWMPGAAFHKWAQQASQTAHDTRTKPFNELKARIAKGEVPVSYTTKLLEANSEGGDRAHGEEMIKVTAGSIYAAGSDTSVLAVTNFLIAMVLHPEIQRKVQAEIDSVIGPDRLPTFSDQENLPYLGCVLKESLRWIVIAPLAVPHAAAQDDVYNGYFIPGGSTVLANVWAILHDETMYSEPFKFWPERFDGRFPKIRDPRAFAFGFNRRVCPGRHFALNALYIQAAAILAAYNLGQVPGENYDNIDVSELSGGDGANFKIALKPRSDTAAKLIRASMEATRA